MNATTGLLPSVGQEQILQPMVELIERLKEATKAAGYSLSGASVAIGLSAQASQKWKKGQIGDDTLKALASLTGYSYIWLRDGLGQKTGDYQGPASGGLDIVARDMATPYQPGELAIPQYDTGGRGGNGGLVLRDQPGVIQNWSVNQEWVRANVPHCTSPRNLCIVTGFGDSMPDTFNPGDPVLVDRGVTACDHDGVYFFRIENEGFIKRLQRIPGVGIRAISQNKEYETWTITPDMDFEVFGKVLRAWKGRNF